MANFDFGFYYINDALYVTQEGNDGAPNFLIERNKERAV